jgi:DNA-binding LacI/PurR family transcriptional regulator
MGEQAAQLLLARIAHPALRRNHIVLKPTLILRGSTAAPGR